jgi:hypothetical protein
MKQVIAGVVLMLSAGMSESDVAIAQASAAGSGSAAPPTIQDAAFGGADTNKDGYLAKIEAEDAGVDNFSVADRNGDGRIDTEEFSACTKNPDSNSDAMPNGMTESGAP